LAQRINKVRLYRPASGEPDAYRRLARRSPGRSAGTSSPSSPIRSPKYATAIRAGTASTEAILRRFTRANTIHPTYQAMIEVGRAQRTMFAARG
jgi:TnpA family transposase